MRRTGITMNRQRGAISEQATDKWKRWLLDTRFGGDRKAAERGMAELTRVRDRVLDGARLREGDTLLDVGCGDGLIAFGALDRVGASGRVIFSDISQPLLDHCAVLAEQMQASDRCAFLRAPADDLQGTGAESLDAVTTRSVLIYVKDKARAFREFYRLLKPGGRASLFEPINSFNESYRSGSWPGEDICEITDLARRLQDFFRNLQPLDTDPMMDFDERDLLGYCEDAGFATIDLRLDVRVGREPPASWDSTLKSSGNPNIPTLGEVIDRLFAPDERQRYESFMRPRVEAGGLVRRGAVAYLRASKE